MSKIETIGTYLGTIVESGINVTAGQQLPQWVARLRVDKKYVEDKAEIDHFTAQGALAGKAGYVDYSTFDQSVGAYLVLYSKKTEKPTLNAEQLFKATGWSFPAFDQLPDLAGKPIQFQVKEKKGYTDQAGQFHDQAGELEVSWIDAPDASPERQIKTVDADQVKALMATYKQFAPKATAKAASFPAAPAAAPRPPVSTPLVAATSSPASSPTSPTASKAPPKKAGPKPKAEQGAVLGVTDECTQIDAWNFVNANKGGADDDTVAEEWSKTTAAVLGNLPEDSATPAHWAKVRDQVTDKLVSLQPA